ncbi:fimbrial protein [Yersinia massiliensis]|uniref:fimbrial protein n=1 Tax=Yersinia massiliensis TaxID=419257 RepID=UPI00031B6FF6|nr:fimbrial protein [Yersinia massiliensis]
MYRIFTYCLLLGLVSTTETYAYNMYFHGTLINPPPCVISGSKQIDVDFSNSVETTKVDGVNYKKPIDYTLACDVNPEFALKMQLKGDVSSFDQTLLLTSVEDLGIQIIRNGQKIDVNEWMYFQYKNIPILEAVPVKNKDAILTGGKFDATATLLVEYI